MQLEKPECPKVMATFRDPKKSEPSKTVTVYNATPADLLERFQQFLKTQEAETTRPAQALSA